MLGVLVFGCSWFVGAGAYNLIFEDICVSFCDGAMVDGAL
jgi:hypothetical protein